MEKEEIDAVMAIWDQLVTSMPPEHMCDKLLQERLLTLEELDEIDKLSSNRQKNRYILKAIIRCPSKNTFNILMKALQSINTVAKDLANILDETYRDLMPNNKSQQNTKTGSTSKEDDWSERDWSDCFQYLAKNLGNNWKMVARQLGLSEGQISDCQANNHGNIVEARIAMLNAWKESWLDNETSSRMKELVEALTKCKLKLYAHNICQKQW